MKITNNKIKNKRKKNGLKQKEFAIKTSISVRSLQNYEAGQREPLVSTAVTLADALQIKTYEEFKDLFGIPQRQLREISTSKNS